MLALEIRINGELKAICGDAALEHLMAWLSAKRNGATSAQDFEFIFQCQGTVPVDAETNEGLKWVHARVKFGDEFSLRFVEVEHAHQPIDRQKYPSKPNPPAA